jgi:hypothetical protein
VVFFLLLWLPFYFNFAFFVPFSFLVYTSFLPAIPLNAKYAEEQRRNLEKGIYPPDVYEYWKQGTAPGWSVEHVTNIPAHLNGLL